MFVLLSSWNGGFFSVITCQPTQLCLHKLFGNNYIGATSSTSSQQHTQKEAHLHNFHHNHYQSSESLPFGNIFWIALQKCEFRAQDILPNFNRKFARFVPIKVHPSSMQSISWLKANCNLFYCLAGWHGC